MRLSRSLLLSAGTLSAVQTTMAIAIRTKLGQVRATASRMMLGVASMIELSQSFG
jgi:hypothetical protein